MGTEARELQIRRPGKGRGVRKMELNKCSVTNYSYLTLGFSYGLCVVCHLSVSILIFEMER